MLQPAGYVPLVVDVDAVAHAAQLAVPGRLTPARSRQPFEADGLTTRSLADACVQHGRRLLDPRGCFDWRYHGDYWIDQDTPLTPSPMGVGHARQARYLDERHHQDGLDVVRLSPGFVYGAGGCSPPRSSSRPARAGCAASAGDNWWSCVHVDDLAQAYLAALTSAPAGAAYAVVDDEPLRLRELTDLTTDALGGPRVGIAPPFLISLLLGRTLVSSLTTSFASAVLGSGASRAGPRPDRAFATPSPTPSRPPRCPSPGDVHPRPRRPGPRRVRGDADPARAGGRRAGGGRRHADGVLRRTVAGPRRRGRFWGALEGPRPHRAGPEGRRARRGAGRHGRRGPGRAAPVTPTCPPAPSCRLPRTTRGPRSLKEVVEEHGWPTHDLVGEDAASAAWLVAQHADFDVEPSSSRPSGCSPRPCRMARRTRPSWRTWTTGCR